MPAATETDSQLFTDVYAMEQDVEPQAAAPIRALFQDLPARCADGYLIWATWPPAGHSCGPMPRTGAMLQLET